MFHKLREVAPPSKHPSAQLVPPAAMPALTTPNVKLSDPLPGAPAPLRTTVSATVAAPLVMHALMPGLPSPHTRLPGRRTQS